MISMGDTIHKPALAEARQSALRSIPFSHVPLVGEPMERWPYRVGCVGSGYSFPLSRKHPTQHTLSPYAIEL
jgi:hypothetical protein